MLTETAAVLAAPANDTTVNPAFVREQARLAEVAKGHWTGAKYNHDLDVAEIARRVRAEYKALAKDPVSVLHGCKFTVRTSRYSMGQSITVRVTPPAGVPVANLRRARLEAEDKHASHGRVAPLFNGRGKAILAAASAVLNAYNFDKGDLVSDYHHDNFHADVEFEAGVLSAEWAEVAAEVRHA